MREHSECRRNEKESETAKYASSIHKESSPKNTFVEWCRNIVRGAVITHALSNPVYTEATEPQAIPIRPPAEKQEKYEGEQGIDPRKQEKYWQSTPAWDSSALSKAAKAHALHLNSTHYDIRTSATKKLHTLCAEMYTQIAPLTAQEQRELCRMQDELFQEIWTMNENFERRLQLREIYNRVASERLSQPTRLPARDRVPIKDIFTFLQNRGRWNIECEESLYEQIAHIQLTIPKDKNSAWEVLRDLCTQAEVHLECDKKDPYTIRISAGTHINHFGTATILGSKQREANGTEAITLQCDPNYGMIAEIVDEVTKAEERSQAYHCSTEPAHSSLNINDEHFIVPPKEMILFTGIQTHTVTVNDAKFTQVGARLVRAESSWNKNAESFATTVFMCIWPRSEWQNCGDPKDTLGFAYGRHCRIESVDGMELQTGPTWRHSGEMSMTFHSDGMPTTLQITGYADVRHVAVPQLLDK